MLDKLVSAWASMLSLQAQKPRCSKRPLYRCKGAVMSVYVQISCDGCDKEARSERVSRTFNSFNGRGYGFGRWHIPSIEEAASQIGWVVFDPYTGCTYCPECWAGIEGSAPSTNGAVK